MCVLSESVDEPAYTKLIKALCAEHGISLVTVPDSKKLGEKSGLCKIDREGVPRKVVGAGVVVVRDYGEESEALNIVLEHLKSRA